MTPSLFKMLSLSSPKQKYMYMLSTKGQKHSLGGLCSFFDICILEPFFWTTPPVICASFWRVIWSTKIESTDVGNFSALTIYLLKFVRRSLLAFDPPSLHCLFFISLRFRSYHSDSYRPCFAKLAEFCSIPICRSEAGNRPFRRNTDCGYPIF